LNVKTDRELVEASKKGVKDAYAELVRRYYKLVFAVCFGILANAADAEDAAQDAMLAGYLKIGSLHSNERYEQWIIQIAKNLCIDMVRRKRHVKLILAQNIGQIAVKPQENHQDLEAGIKRLPLELRMPLIMYYFNGKNLVSIAERFKISHTQVSKRINEARKQLFKWLTGGSKNEPKL